MQLLIGPEAGCLGWYKGRFWEKERRCWERQEKKKGQVKSQEAIAGTMDKALAPRTWQHAGGQSGAQWEYLLLGFSGHAVKSG